MPRYKQKSQDVRQDANAAFARTSFLYGGNAAYVEKLQSQLRGQSLVGRRRMAAFFESLKDERGDVLKDAGGPSWQRPIQHASWRAESRR